MTKVNALRIEQQGRRMYVTALTLRQIMAHQQVDYWSETNQDGYQRPLLTRRLEDVSDFITKEDGIFPTNIVLCARAGDAGLRFQASGSSDGVSQVGALSIRKDTDLWIVDGQHRLFGAQRAVEAQGEGSDVAELPFAVTILDGLTRYEEMVNFHMINTRDHRVPTDIADRHLVQRLFKEGEGFAKGRQAEKDRLRARGTAIVDILNRSGGIWTAQVKIPGIEGREKGLVKQHALVFSLEPVLKDAYLGQLDNEPLAELLDDYWAAIAGIWPAAIREPKQHRLQGTAGIYTMHMLMPAVVQLALVTERRLSRKNLANILKHLEDTGRDFWHKERGDPLTQGGALGPLRKLSQKLQSRLPKISVFQ